MPIRRGALFLAALATQIAIEHGLLPIPKSVYPPLIAATYGLLFFGVASNLNFYGFRLLLIGLALNVAALAVNGWYMPVTPEALLSAGFPEQASLASGTVLEPSKSVLLTHAETNLWPLTDIFPASWPVHIVFSVGDVLILIAAVVQLAELIVRRREFGGHGRTQEAVV